jgi:hypothetical protein
MASMECWGDIVEHVSACREKCQFWGTRRGCRRGNKCKLLHGDTNALRLPYVSRYIDKDGVHQLALRPPIDPDALDLFFDGRPKTLHSMRQLKTPNHGMLLYFDLKHMVERDEVACVASVSANGVFDTSGKLRGNCNKILPAYCAHTTDVPALLKIVLSGAISPTIKGTAGAGIYTFTVKDLSDECLVETYSRAGKGGYGVAAIILEMAGICIKTSKSETYVIPPGATSYIRDQWVSSPTAVRYVGCMVNMDAFVYALGEHLASVGYSVELHRALLQAQDFLSKDADGKANLENIETATQNNDGAQKSQSSSSHGSSKVQMDATVKHIETATQKNDKAQKSQSSSSHGRSKLQMDATVNEAQKWLKRRKGRGAEVDEAQKWTRRTVNEAQQNIETRTQTLNWEASFVHGIWDERQTDDAPTWSKAEWEDWNRR